MALIWLCIAFLLLGVLVVVIAVCKVAARADEAVDAAWVPAAPSYRMIYPGIPLRQDFIEYLTGICNDYDVPVPLVLAVIARESDFDDAMVDDHGQSFGLMQIQPQWHRERMKRLGVIDLLDPAQNVLVGVDYLAELLDLGRGEEYAVMWYNGGEVHANSYFKRGEMSAYCAEVMRMRDCIAGAAMPIPG